MSDVRNGFSCLQGELGTFGSCFHGRCRRRCSAGADECKPPVGEFRGMLADETKCTPLTGANVSVCVQDAER